jgi:glyoxylase-like metal-dependent hydrolase (beta-lactamase superfamily II)
MTINRRQFLGSSAAAIAGAALVRTPGWARAQQAQAPVTKFEELRGGVGYFTGQGGTIGWLATPEGAVAVDSQYAATAAACIAGLQQRSAKGIRMLINTHHHGDHVGGNSAFRPAVANIVQHERCAQYHRSTTTANAATQAYADMTFGSTWAATVGPETIRAKYYGPGHTGGDAVIVFERANVVHMGDLMFNKSHPFIDRANGASVRNWITVLTQVESDHRDATFIFGHAKAGLPVVGTRAEVANFRGYLSAVLDTAQKAVTAGQPLAELVKLTALPGFEDYAGSSARLSLAGALTAAYEELTAR